MIEARFRPITDVERRLFEKLLAQNFAGRDALSDQLKGMLARVVDEEGSLALKVCSPVRATVRHRVPVDARYADLDTVNEAGPYVNILLHVKDGQIVELEIYKDDQSAIQRRPNKSDLEVFVR